MPTVVLLPATSTASVQYIMMTVTIYYRVLIHAVHRLHYKPFTPHAGYSLEVDIYARIKQAANTSKLLLDELCRIAGRGTIALL